MKKGFALPVVLVGIIVVVVAGVIIYFLKKIIDLPGYPPQQPLQISQATPPAQQSSPTTDETADWKTYSNTQLGIEFKYPPEYQIIKETGKTALVGYHYTPEDPTIITALTITNDNFTNYAILGPCTNFKNDPNVFADKLPCFNNKSWAQNEPIARTNLAGVKAESVYLTYGVDGEHHIIKTIEPPLIELKMNIAGGSLEYNFQKILSTFKFLD